MCRCSCSFQPHTKIGEISLGILGILVRHKTSVLLLLLAMIAAIDSRPIDGTIDSAEETTTEPISEDLQLLFDGLAAADNNPPSEHHEVYRRSAEERWSNPCRWPGFIFDESYLEGVPPADPLATAKRILQATKTAKGPAEQLFNAYVKHVFKDPKPINGLNIRLKWLPEAKTSEVKHMSLRNAIQYFSDKVLYYGVAISQVTVDQALYNGEFIEQTREVEVILTQDVCQLQLGAMSLGVLPSKTDLHDAMEKNYKDMPSKSQRDFRDILIIRDYLEFLKVMEETFERIVERTLQNSSTHSDDAASVH